MLHHGLLLPGHRAGVAISAMLAKAILSLLSALARASAKPSRHPTPRRSEASAARMRHQYRDAPSQTMSYVALAPYGPSASNSSSPRPSMPSCTWAIVQPDAETLAHLSHVGCLQSCFYWRAQACGGC